jgi:ABC-type branched-subunit amino acid transport system ATPase component
VTASEFNDTRQPVANAEESTGPGAKPADSGPVPLKVTDLAVSYVNGPAAVRGVSFTAKAGTVTAIVGPNGAGKTSLLQAIAGRERRSPMRLDGGSVVVDGHELLGAPSERVARSGVAFIPDRTKVFASLSVDEHLQLALRRIPRRERGLVRAGVLEAFPRVTGWLDRSASQLSGGERQLVSMAVALCRRPRLLLIDEMSQGLSPAAIGEVGRALRVLRARGIAVVLVEQAVAVAEELSDVVMGYVRGELVDLETLEVASHGTR